MRCLTSLEIDSAHFLSATDWQNVSRCSKLQTLMISQPVLAPVAANSTLAPLANAIASLVSLEFLQLVGVESLSDYNLSEILAPLRVLTTLVVDGCPRLTVDGVSAVLQKAAALQCLRWYSIDPGSLAVLRQRLPTLSIDN
jgi:hypothetical protein